MVGLFILASSLLGLLNCQELDSLRFVAIIFSLSTSFKLKYLVKAFDLSLLGPFTKAYSASSVPNLRRCSTINSRGATALRG
jgi:hypothetical protein